ncbi:hypothetical protein INR49_016737 [Caranx melampygus]|nr:hypothetical protein INR49_016737 [Caranx melampygus]
MIHLIQWGQDGQAQFRILSEEHRVDRCTVLLAQGSCSAASREPSGSQIEPVQCNGTLHHLGVHAGSALVITVMPAGDKSGILWRHIVQTDLENKAVREHLAILREAAPPPTPLMSLLEVSPGSADLPQQRYKYAQPALLSTHSITPTESRSGQAVRTSQLILSETTALKPPEKQDEMSTYVSSESRRVSPSVHGNKFDTAHRKKAVANIFESVNQDALMRLFQKTGDMKAEERVRSIFSYTQDPEETARALMALKQRKKDKFLQIAGMVRQLLNLR